MKTMPSWFGGAPEETPGEHILGKCNPPLLYGIVHDRCLHCHNPTDLSIHNVIMLSHVVYTFRPYLSHLAFIAFIAFMRESALRSWVFFGVQQSFTLLEVEFKQNMDQMNEMMESRGLPTELRVPWLIVFFMANPWGGAKLRLFSVEDQQKIILMN